LARLAIAILKDVKYAVKKKSKKKIIKNIYIKGRREHFRHIEIPARDKSTATKSFSITKQTLFSDSVKTSDGGMRKHPAPPCTSEG